MWPFGDSKKPEPAESTSTSHIPAPPRGNGNDNLSPPEHLPKKLQDLIDEADKDESFYDELWGGTAPQSTESNIRYAAYASRIRTALLSAQRYVAYTSDIGESFRPVAHPNWLRAAYGISWAYLVGDVTHEGYKAYCMNQRVLHPELIREANEDRYNNAKNAPPAAVAAGTEIPVEPIPGIVPPLEDYRAVIVQRAVFQSIASMGLPAFTIHSIVRYSGRAMKDIKNVRLRTWGPIGLGLAAVPALPFLFDKPVEEAVEWTFHKGFEAFGGKDAVGDAPSTGREGVLERDLRQAAQDAKKKQKEKEKKL